MVGIPWASRSWTRCSSKPWRSTSHSVTGELTRSRVCTRCSARLDLRPELGWCVSDGVDQVRAFLLTRCAATSCGIIRSIVDARGVVHCGGPITGLSHGRQPHATTATVWFSDSIQAEALYGHISTWETRDVTDMKNLFPSSELFPARTLAAGTSQTSRTRPGCSTWSRRSTDRRLARRQGHHDARRVLRGQGL